LVAAGRPRWPLIAAWSAALLLLAAYTALLLWPIYSGPETSDFATFYAPAARLWLAGRDPYAVRFFVQPPALLALVAPFAALPPEVGRAAWLASELGLATGACAATLAALGWSRTRPWALPVLLVYLSPNVAWGLMIGQSTLLVWALQAAGWLLLRRGHSAMAGLCLGAIVFKPHMLLVAAPLLLLAPRRAWATAAAAVAILLLVPELLGPPLLVSWLRHLVLEVGEQRYNKLTPADMFANLAGPQSPLQAAGWVVLAAGALYLGRCLLLLWRERSVGADATAAAGARPSAALMRARAAAYLPLPYTLAYDIVLAADVHLWRWQRNGWRLDRALTWQLGLLWLLPVLTLLLHAAGVASTLNPLLVLGMLLLVRGAPDSSPLGGRQGAVRGRAAA